MDDSGAHGAVKFILQQKDPAAQNLAGKYLQILAGDYSSPHFARGLTL